VDDGRDELSVAEGVALGVETGLLKPTRDFLADERGVTLVFIAPRTGVRSSCEADGAFGVPAMVLRVVRRVGVLLAETAEGARRGAMGVFAVRVVASVGFSGRPLLVVLDRSVGMVPN
jgi:hypothetical protein